MGARFDRWLARPSTLHFLRQLVEPLDRPARARRCVAVTGFRTRRWNGTTAVAVAPQAEGKNARRRSPTLRHMDHTAEEALTLSAQELGLHMSFRAGVAIFGEGGGQLTSLGDGASFDTLRNQADVSSGDKRGTLLVDQDQHRHNLRLWIELLQFRQRLDGLEGVVAVWQGMRQRNVELPSEGEEADFLWTTFICASIAAEELAFAASTQDIYNYAVDLKERTGLHWDKLYKCIVGSLLRTNAGGTIMWHRYLSRAGLVPPDALKSLARDVLQSDKPPAAFNNFKMLYIHSTERDVYDTFISEALRLEDEIPALRVHRLFIKHGDAPSPEMFARPDVQRLFDLDRDASLPMKHVKKRAVSAGSSDSLQMAVYPALTRASMSSLVGDAHGIKPKEISDTFVAKMFATRAFSLDLVIGGLGFFAVDKLGPVAVRELAVRAGSPVELCNRLSTLKAVNIAIGDSVYGRLIQSLASEGQSELYHTLLASDQHPEAYEDTQTQEALLASFLEAGDWKQAHITLLGLSLAGAEQQAAAWNRVVQHYLQQRQHQLVAHTIQHLQAQKAPLTFTTLTYLHRYLLPVRRVRMRPIESQRVDRPPFNALDFVTNACMYADDIARENSNPEHYVRPRVWRELLKRYGMTHRWLEFTKLALWLADRYSTLRFRIGREEDGEGHGRAGGIILRPSCPLPFIFEKQMQQAVFTWGFRSAAVRHMLRPGGRDVWAQGLVLLLHLRSRGVVVSDEVIQHAFRTRMWILFGPGHSTMAINETIRRDNRLSLGHYIRTANEMWRDQLVDIDTTLLDDDVELEPQLMLAFFGPYRRVGWRKEEQSTEVVDVGSWARAIRDRQWSTAHRGRTAKQRHRVWERNPFRRLVPRAEPKVSGVDGTVTTADPEVEGQSIGDALTAAGLP